MLKRTTTAAAPGAARATSTGPFADYNQAIQLNPKYGRAYVNRGSAWGNKGDLDRAIADYNQAIRLDPKERESLLQPRHGVGDETQSASGIG